MSDRAARVLGVRVPLTFAYGANLDIAAMAVRCPRSVPLGPARLIGHRFFIMRNGYASVQPEPGATVHGLLWRLDPADVAALDAFEEVARGLYAKVLRPVVRSPGVAQALVYLGRDTGEGRPRPGYLEAVLAAARRLDLPEPYLRSLAALATSGDLPRQAAIRHGRGRAPG